MSLQLGHTYTDTKGNVLEVLTERNGHFLCIDKRDRCAWYRQNGTLTESSDMEVFGDITQMKDIECVVYLRRLPEFFGKGNAFAQFLFGSMNGWRDRQSSEFRHKVRVSVEILDERKD